MKTVSLFLLSVFSLNMPVKKKYCYIALGDSYTICTGTTAENSWPVLLTKHLNEESIEISLRANPSHNGWTTQDLIDRELPLLEDPANADVNFVTLLIGVNDWVQGVDAKTFQKNLSYIIDKVQSKLPDKSKLVLITIPDFGVTPTGSRFSGGRNIPEGISEFNSIIIAEAKKRNLKTVDLFEISKDMGKDRSLIADDGLHPSAKEYAKWEKLIYPVVAKVLK